MAAPKAAPSSICFAVKSKQTISQSRSPISYCSRKRPSTCCSQADGGQLQRPVTSLFWFSKRQSVSGHFIEMNEQSGIFEFSQRLERHNIKILRGNIRAAICIGLDLDRLPAMVFKKEGLGI